MVLGIGEGIIELTVANKGFRKGRPIKGKVKLLLKKPIQARSLRIEFFGICWDRYTRAVHSTTKEISGKREYRSNEEFEFNIMPPNECFEPPKGLVNNIYPGTFPYTTTWHLRAKLDLPKKIDLATTIPLEKDDG